MEGNPDFFSPLPVGTPTTFLSQLSDPDDKYLKPSELYSFEIDTFPVPGIDDIPTAIPSLSPIPEETGCSLSVPSFDQLFPSVETVPVSQNFENFQSNKVSPTNKQIKCDLCQQSLPNVHALHLHRRVQHTSSKEFRCRKCPQSFNFQSNLLLHLASHISSCATTKECPECKKVFKRSSSFRGHLKSHQTNDRFKCNRCEKEFDFKSTYEKHLIKVHKPGSENEENLIKQAARSKGHIRNRIIQGKYRCQSCGKGFTKPCLLRRHEVCHTGQKPFQCNECNQGFTQKASLERHERLHRGIKDFECPKCNCSFAQKNNLIVHIQRTHPSRPDLEKMFPCEYCSCVFGKLNSVSRHKALMHPVQDNSQSGQNNDDETVDVAKVIEQLKALQEPMGDADIPAVSLEVPTVKPPSPAPKIRTIMLVDTLNPNKEKTYTMVKEILHKGKRTIACIYCDKSFKRQFDLLRHYRTHTKERPFQCKVCTKNFPTSAALKVHLNIHFSSLSKPAKVHACAVAGCGKLFSSLRKLDFHARSHASTIAYICPLCSKSFTSKSAFSAHKHRDNDTELNMIRPLLLSPVKLESKTVAALEKSEEYCKRSYQCYICGLKFQKCSHLRQHEATHSGHKSFVCPICHRSYTTKSSLNQHLKIHSSEKPYNCDTCDARFVSQFLLKRHMITHTNERKFACPYCTKRFKSNDNCKNHILTHARTLLATTEHQWDGKDSNINEQPIEGTPLESVSQAYIAVVQSPGNNQSPKFLQLEMIKNCKRHNHTNITFDTLPEMPKKQARKSLAQTLKRINQPIHQCDDCGKSFNKASDLERHIRTHTKEKPFICTECPKRFALMSTLTHHLTTHDSHRTTYECQVCGKKYASQKVLTVHLRIHTGERPFQCNICNQTFRTSGHKISHIKVHHKKKK